VHEGWTPAVGEAIEKPKASLRYLPKYSPDLNPIELPYSKFKTFVDSVEPVRMWRRPCRHREIGQYDVSTPRGRRGRHVRKECVAESRNRSRVASVPPHSEGIAYKPPCGEIAMCPRVGCMRSIK
jgi:DDE superfamily endonuclease